MLPKVPDHGIQFELREAIAVIRMAHFNKEIFATVYAANASHDLATIQKMNHPQIIVQQAERLSWGGTYRRLEGTRQFMGKVGSTVTIDQMFSRVASTWVVMGCTSGRVCRSGAEFSVPLVYFRTLEGGLITRLEPFLHFAKLSGFRKTSAR